MKTFVKLILTVLFSIFATNANAVSNNLSPFSVNIEGVDPGDGTASSSDIFRDTTTIEGFDDVAGDFVAPAWLEILTLVSPANYPISTFLTSKTLDGIKGLAKAQAQEGEHSDILINTSKENSRFNPKYQVKRDQMENWKQFSEEKVKNYKLNWGDIAVLPFQDTVGAAFAGGAVSGTLTVANAAMWKVSHTAKVQNGAYANGDDLVVYVGGVDTNAGTIAVYSLSDDGSENIPVIADGARLTRMGVASSELAIKNDAITQAPTSEYNYAQKFITSVVYSNWMMMTQLFTNYSYSMVTNLALQDFRYGQEYSFMFGLRSGATVPVPSGGSEKVYTTGGLTYFIDQEIEYGTGGGDTTITETDIVDFTKEMRVGNNGNDTRFLYAGSELISSLNKGIMSNSTRFVQKEFDTVYGLSFTVLYSFFGTINVIYAPLLDQTEWRDRGFLLDMQYVDKFVFEPFRQDTKDLEKLRISAAQAVDMVETCGLVVRNTGTHFELKVKA